MLVAFHLEPYPGRTALSVREDVVYLVNKFGHSRCLYRRNNLPVYYVCVGLHY
jgi:glycoprotein endo-alpha-1,2-mannosidase